MTAEEVTYDVYEATFGPTLSHAYNSVAFAELNSAKADTIRYLSIGDNKPRCGIIFGEREGKLISGFSAPFGGFDFVKRLTTDIMMEAARALTGFLKGVSASIVLPPEFFDSSHNAMARYALVSAGWQDETLVNNHFDLTRGPYESVIDKAARKRLRKSENSGASFEPVGLDRAYAVIAENRRMRGYPLAMSLDEVLSTSPITLTRGYAVSYNGADVAAAIVNDISAEVSQIVYWGDNGLSQEVLGMKLLASKLYEHYRAEGRRYLDIGPSGTWGELSPMLSFFKEHVGASTTLKHRLSLQQS